ncbi:MAG: RHS repeat-associated protein [Phenylobacterium sp.]|jgi:RHS repeat-associated protein
MGHLSDLTYPDASVGKVSFAPNAFGQASKATRANAIYASNASYYPTGTVNTFTYGNGITHKTELNDRRQPSSIRDHLNQSDRLNMAYEYDHQSNITKISDNINAAYSLANLAYDGLDRLTSTTGGNGIGSSSMAYDALGNITQYTSKGASLNYSYNLSLNRLTSVNDSIGSKNYNFAGGYDGRGNVTYNGHRFFDYNLANQMTGSSGNLYLYDGFNRRIRTQDSHGTSFSMYSQAGKLLYRETKDGGINYIFLGDKLIAKEGVMPVSTNSRMHYKPFGDSIETPKDDVGYTGHKFDTDLGWSYMQQRYMDPVLARFMQNDPVGFTGDVTTYNRYSYVGNNPYKYTDPDGGSRKSKRKQGMATANLIARGVASVTEEGSALNHYADAVVEATETALTGKPRAGKKAKDSSKNSAHGDDGRAKKKAQSAIGELEKKQEGSKGTNKKKMKQKIKNMKKTAEKKKKGEEHSRGAKR